MKKHTTLLIVFFTVFIDLLGFGILIPLLPFVVTHFEASAFTGGILMASYSIAQFIFAPVWGRLSDKIGRKPVILISLTGSVIGYLLFAYADSNWGFFTYFSPMVWLFASRILSGMAAANISTAQAIVADCLPPDQRTKGMGMVGAAIGLGFTLGPAMAGIIGLENHYSLPFLIAAGLSGLDLVLAFFLLPETIHMSQDNHAEKRRFSFAMLRTALQKPIIPRLLMVSLTYYIAFAAMESTFGFYIEKVFQLTERHNGYILFMVGIIIVIIQGGFVGRVAKRYGDRNVLTCGIAGVLIGLFLIGAAPSVLLMILSVVVMAAASGFVMPSMTSLLSQHSDKEIQGGILGLNQSMASMGRILGPLMGTFLFEHLFPPAPFWAGALFIMVALVLILPLISKHQTNCQIE